ncbi:hypothetical protein [Hyphomicrobium sp. CS1BSMeth3]|uniref:hypothetical protein n=1 Tax=Hyphomicrobium sp. CS1BSMeth3 TaxID=1892844 RepID=UPI000930F793|nr:hypothetical protein [Hyphomicrobium sp. CS1BSMeth3]
MAEDALSVGRKLDAARASYVRVRERLNALLPQASGPHEIADHLLSYAEEFGVEKTLADVEAKPGHFDLKAAPSGLRPLLEQAQELSRECDLLAAKFDKLVHGGLPVVTRTMCHLGRMFELDQEKGEMRYLDNGERHPIPPDLVAPDDGRARSRERGRSR